jgi:hypothetical protein
VFLGGAGELQTEIDGTLFLPSNLVSNSPSVFCMKVPVGERIPRFFGEGDFVVIEPAPLNLDRMVDSIVAVYFEERPPSIELGSDSSTRFFETMRAAAKFGEEERRIWDGLE